MVKKIKIKNVAFIKTVLFSFFLCTALGVQGCAKINIMSSMDSKKPKASQTVVETKQKNLFRKKLSKLADLFNKDLKHLNYLSEKSKQFSNFISEGWSGLTRNLFQKQPRQKNLIVLRAKDVSKHINTATHAMNEVNAAAETIFSSYNQSQRLEQNDLNTLEQVLMAGKRIKIKFIKQAEQLKSTDQTQAIYITDQIEAFNQSLKLMNHYANQFGSQWRIDNKNSAQG